MLNPTCLPSRCVARDTQKDKVYDQLVTLVHNSKGCDILMVADDYNSQDKERSASEACLRRRCALPAQRTSFSSSVQTFVGFWLARIFLTKYSRATTITNFMNQKCSL